MQSTTTTSRTRRRTVGGVVAGALLGAAVLPAAAAQLASPPAPEPLDRVAFVARNDVAADALGVGPVAGALGGIVVTTPSGSLSDAAEQALTEFAPETVYIAGGAAAISADTEAQIDALGDWDIERLAGAGRDETAYLVGKVLADLGVGRPMLTGAQVVGDSHLGGTFYADVVDLTRQVHTATFDASADGSDPIELTGDAELASVDVDLPAQSCGITETTVYQVLVEGEGTALSTAPAVREFRVGLGVDEDAPAFTGVDLAIDNGFAFANAATRGEFLVGAGMHTFRVTGSTSGSDITGVRGGITATVVGWDCGSLEDISG